MFSCMVSLAKLLFLVSSMRSMVMCARIRAQELDSENGTSNTSLSLDTQAVFLTGENGTSNTALSLNTQAVFLTAGDAYYMNDLKTTGIKEGSNVGNPNGETKRQKRGDKLGKGMYCTAYIAQGTSKDTRLQTQAGESFMTQLWSFGSNRAPPAYVAMFYLELESMKIAVMPKAVQYQEGIENGLQDECNANFDAVWIPPYIMKGVTDEQKCLAFYQKYKQLTDCTETDAQTFLYWLSIGCVQEFKVNKRPKIAYMFAIADLNAGNVNEIKAYIS